MSFSLFFQLSLLFFEILKQVIYTLQAGHYQWYAFPFQFCSVPIYLVPLALLIRNEKIKTALYNFLSFYVLLAGLIVMFYPGDVFTTDVVINFQTMIHHMSMVLIGFAITFAGKKQLFVARFFKCADCICNCLSSGFNNEYNWSLCGYRHFQYVLY